MEGECGDKHAAEEASREEDESACVAVGSPIRVPLDLKLGAHAFCRDPGNRTSANDPTHRRCRALAPQNQGALPISKGIFTSHSGSVMMLSRGR
jgi:hypothetical protein